MAELQPSADSLVGSGEREGWAFSSDHPIKVLFGLLLPQTIGFVASLLRLTNIEWRVTDYMTLGRQQKHLSRRSKAVFMLPTFSSRKAEIAFLLAYKHEFGVSRKIATKPL